MTQNAGLFRIPGLQKVTEVGATTDQDVSVGGLDVSGDILMSTSSSVISRGSSWGQIQPRNTVQTVDTMMFQLGSTSNYLLFCQYADRNVDFGHAAPATPTLIVQDTDPNDFISFTHDDTDGVIATGAGDLSLAPAGNVVATGGLVGSFKESKFIPIEWAEDGSSPPGASVLVTSGNGSVRVRKFDHTGVEDVVIPWEVPEDIVAGDGIKFWVCGVITESTAPAAGEGVSFKMSGYSIGLGDALNGTFGTEIESANADLNATGCDTQYDRFITAESGTVTVTDLAATELAMLHLERDTADSDDDYAQDVGVYGIVIEYSRRTAAA